jgi:hypothetical protein
MNIEDFKNIIEGVTQSHLDNNVDVKVISAYGGRTCWIGKISDVLDLIRDEERCVNKDFYIVLF